jgi:hypothetical protein
MAYLSLLVDVAFFAAMVAAYWAILGITFHRGIILVLIHIRINNILRE